MIKSEGRTRNVSTVVWTFCHAVVLYISKYTCQKKDRTQRWICKSDIRMKCERLGLVLSHLSPPYFDNVLQVRHGWVERDEENSIFCKLLSREWWVAWQVKQWASSVGDLDQVQGEFELKFWDNALPAQNVSLKFLIPFRVYAGQRRRSWSQT